MTLAPFSPMLASPWRDRAEGVEFPLIVQPKFDGWRCIIAGGAAWSREGRPIAHPSVAALAQSLAAAGFPPLDGELIAGDPLRPMQGQFEATSAILNNPQADGSSLRYVAFDCLADPAAAQSDRLAALAQCPRAPFVIIAPQFDVETVEALAELDQDHYCRGYEGVIIRDPFAPYQPGRAGAAGPLWKQKRFADDEATITGAAPLEQRGKTKELVGAFLCDWRGRRFSIGAGLTTKQRAEYWARRGALVGARLTFRHQGFTESGLPRHAVFMRLRDDAPAAPAPQSPAAPLPAAPPSAPAPLPAIQGEEAPRSIPVGLADPIPAGFRAPDAAPGELAPYGPAPAPVTFALDPAESREIFDFTVLCKGADGWHAFGRTSEGAFGRVGPFKNRLAARRGGDRLTKKPILVRPRLAERIADWLNLD